MTSRLMLLLIGIFVLVVPVHSQDWTKTCKTHGSVCEFPRKFAPLPAPQQALDWRCQDRTSLTEHRFVCVSGPKKGQGFDVWCRDGAGYTAGTIYDHKCNVNRHDACPIGKESLTQWTVTDHCTQAGAGGNWNRPADWIVPDFTQK